MTRLIRTAVSALLMSGAVSASAGGDTVYVKYRGPVSLRHFQCAAVSSSLVGHVCHDSRRACMLIALNGTWYHYCRIPADAVQALVTAPSVGKHYNVAIKGRYDCRLGGVPEYPS